MNIAIDGPAGAGKSTVAKAVARQLGYIYVDTGAMYRAIGLYMIQNHIDINDSDTIIASLDNIHIDIRYEDGIQRVYLNETDVSDMIRTEEVGKAASSTSAIKEVRDKLLDMQRNIALHEDIVMDGRDIGTVVLPDAQIKIYLTADAHTRAIRRYSELIDKGISCSIDEIENDIIKRDDRDIHREISPLTVADDAIVIDSSDMSIEDVTHEIISIVKNHR